MTVEQVINIFKQKMPFLEVKQIFRGTKDGCIVMAVKRGTTIKEWTSPNSYIITRTGKIAPLNPLDNLDAFVKVANSKNVIYDAGIN